MHLRISLHFGFSIKLFFIFFTDMQIVFVSFITARLKWLVNYLIFQLEDFNILFTLFIMINVI